MSLSRAMAALLGMLLCTALPARAEAPVNFSGTWELDRGRSTFPAGSPSAVGAEMTLVIHHQGEAVRIERRAKVLAMHRTIMETYYTDGRETSNPTMRGDSITSRSQWDGTALVTKRSGQSRQMETTDVMRLSDDGAVLTIDSTIRRGQEAPLSSRLVFVKK
ncbi:MAG: hypothetical protein HY294_02605 [Candidatus Rokubacteria bacterium]|nr:hypothetical protein [Candidatus Rokubacteria bacterium]